MTFVFFTDRDLGTRFPQILVDAGLDVNRHQDHFAHDCPDDVWLESIGEWGWIALTHDRKIRYKPNELSAVMQHGVALLVVIGKATHQELANAFVATMPRIAKFLAEHSPPFIGKVYRPSKKQAAQNPEAPGRVELWYPK